MPRRLSRTVKPVLVWFNCGPAENENQTNDDKRTKVAVRAVYWFLFHASWVVWNLMNPKKQTKTVVWVLAYALGLRWRSRKSNSPKCLWTNKSISSQIYFMCSVESGMGAWNLLTVERDLIVASCSSPSCPPSLVFISFKYYIARLDFLFHYESLLRT